MLLAAGFVAHSSQILADMRLVRFTPAAKILAPTLVHLFLPTTLNLKRKAHIELDHRIKAELVGEVLERLLVPVHGVLN